MEAEVAMAEAEEAAMGVDLAAGVVSVAKHFTSLVNYILMNRFVSRLS